jgi:hypothetical protein
MLMVVPNRKALPPRSGRRSWAPDGALDLGWRLPCGLGLELREQFGGDTLRHR